MFELGRSNRMGALAALAAMGLFVAGGAHAQGGKPGAMEDMPGMGGTAGVGGAKQQAVGGKGTVAAVDVGQNKVTLDHEPIPAIGWPAMHMEFTAAKSVDVSKLKPGAKVEFTLSGTKGTYTVQSITTAP